MTDISLSPFIPADFAKTPFLLLYFYPKDNTPGCTLEAKDFSCLREKFLGKGITVVGVSPDSPASHEKFTMAQDLTISLISDPDHTLAEKFGAYGEKKNYGKTYFGIIRSTFLLDTRTGKILKEWRNVKAAGHAERVLGECEN
ncbi:MAG: peroxiredoxin [Candidatus Peregrinibacteria bacterium]